MGGKGAVALAVLAFALLVGVASAIANAGNLEGSGEPSAQDPEALTQPSAKELVQRRTATSNTFALSDGTLETRIYEVPVNYRDEDGDWQPIDQGLRETASGAVVNGENSFDVHLPEDLDQGPVRVTVGEEWVSEIPLGIDTEPADMEKGGIASYSLDGGAADIEFTGLANGLKETIELADPSAPSTYHFKLEASAGVEPALATDGSIEFRDENDDLVAVMPAPFMVDSSDATAPSDAIQYRLEAAGSGQAWNLAVEADPQWLDAPERNWPVIIDPSWTVPAPFRDCIIATDTSAQMCGTLGFGYLAAKAKYASSGPDAFARTLLRFDVNTIPKAASLSSASIELNSVKTATNITKVDLYDLNRRWSTAATWSNWTATGAWTTPGGDFGKEMPTPASVTTAARGSQPGWWKFSSASLTKLVQLWRENAGQGAVEHGVIIKLADESPRVCCMERRVEWESSAGANKPRLVVQYQLPLPATAGGKIISPTDGSSTARRFVLKAGWDQSNVEGVTFQYKDGNVWVDVPPAQVTDQDNQTISQWPYGVDIDLRENDPLYWDASSLADAKGIAKVKVRAVLSGAPGANGFTKAVEAELNENGGGPKDGSVSIGPGAVDLLTGNFSVSRTDVAISGYGSPLEFSRSISSRETTVDQAGVLGQGWKAGGPVEAGGSTWRSLKIESFTESFEGIDYTEKWARLTPLEGPPLSFEELSNGQFAAPPEATGNVLFRDSATGDIWLTDPNGTRTVFSNFGSGNEYWPVSVVEMGGAENKTRLIYEVDGTKRRLKWLIAPAEGNISCVDATAITRTGCRVLGFHYEKATQWGAPESMVGGSPRSPSMPRATADLGTLPVSGTTRKADWLRLGIHGSRRPLKRPMPMRPVGS